MWIQIKPSYDAGGVSSIFAIVDDDFMEDYTTPILHSNLQLTGYSQRVGSEVWYWVLAAVFTPVSPWEQLELF